MQTIPTIKELYTNRLADLQTEFNGNINPFGKAFLRALAAVLAGTDKILFLFLGNIQKNIWPDTADPEAVGGTLERFGRTKKVQPFTATQGYYICSISGNAGATISASTTFKSDDSSENPGYLFVLDTAYTLSGSGDSITLRALTGGTVSALAVGNTLTAMKPLINVNPTATVTAISASPIDGETTEQFRARVVELYTLEPQGGAAADYRLWGKTVAGVQQIYPYTLSGENNTVEVFVEAIAADSSDGKGTPTVTIQNNVEDVYAPANGLVPLGVMPIQVSAISILSVNITIPGTTGLTDAQKTLLTNALAEAIGAIRPFVAAIDDATERNDTLSIILPATTGSQLATTKYVIVSIITSTLPGIAFTLPTMTITRPAGSPVSYDIYQFTYGDIPFLNSVTFP